MKKVKEKNVHQQVADYIKFQYPNVIFTSDASGMRVGMGLRMELKRKRCAKYKILDLLILCPSGPYYGLFIEVKTSVEEVFKKDLTIKSSDQIKEQMKTIDELNRLGYAAGFGCGFNHCKEKIDAYFSLYNKI